MPVESPGDRHYGRDVPVTARVASPPPRVTVLFDGDCTFCRLWIERLRQITGTTVAFHPYQDDRVSRQFPELARADLERSVHSIDTLGNVHNGAEAVFRVLEPWHPGWKRTYELLPGFAWITEACYRFVAGHRMTFSRLTRWIWGGSVEHPGHDAVRSLYLRGLGIVYLMAFLSLGGQIGGLVGSQGILPAEQSIAAVLARENVATPPWRHYLHAPTLCWWSASDASLRLQWTTGAVASVAVILGIAPAPILALLWILYLSLTTIGGLFLGYQWDALLLEAGFLALLWAPFRWREPMRGSAGASGVVLFLHRWLVARLLFSSGVAKWWGGDPAWRDLTALGFHFETQPLPTSLAWHAHALPSPVLQASTALMLTMEILLPALVFLPWRLRRWALGPWVGLQVAILLTGNYGFFNWLTLLLCGVLLDDRTLARWIPWMRPPALADSPTPETAITGPKGAARVPWPLRLALGGFMIALTLPAIPSMSRVRTQWPEWLMKARDTIGPFQVANRYGLFATMTTTRPEIFVEVSRDGVEWVRWDFTHKPGDPTRAPGWIAPHMPRLDWQMWFAALGNWQDNPWLARLAQRLLEGSPEVVPLMGPAPLGESRPAYLRYRVERYQFTTSAERMRTGMWWTRGPAEDYSPILSLRKGAE